MVVTADFDPCHWPFERRCGGVALKAPRLVDNETEFGYGYQGKVAGSGFFERQATGVRLPSVQENMLGPGLRRFEIDHRIRVVVQLQDRVHLAPNKTF